MDLALNLLSAKNAPSSQTAPAQKPKTQKPEQKTNFSDTLNKAVSKQSNEQSPELPEKAKASLPKMPMGIVKKPINAAGEVEVSADSPIVEAVLPEDGMLKPDKELMAGINNTAIVPQLTPLIQPTTAGEVAALVEQAVSPISSLSDSESQTKFVSNAILKQAKATPETAANNLPENAPNNNVPNAQGGQEQTIPANPSPMVQKNNAPLTQVAAVNIVNDNAKQAPLETVVANPILKAEQNIRPTEVNSELEGTAENIIPNQSTMPVAAHNRELKKDFTGEGHKENSFEATLLKEAKLQKAASTATEVFPEHMIQGIDAAAISSNNNITAAAKTVEIQQPSQPVDVHEVAKQIVEQTRLITKPQNTEMIIKLKPEHLGELTLRVVIENGAVNASFHSNNSEVRNIIEASLPQLKQDMTNTGLKVDNVSVYAGLSQFLPNHDQDRNSRQQVIKFTNKKSGKDFIEAIDEELTKEKISGNSETGVDYRI